MKKAYEVDFNIIKHVADIVTYQTGWTMELNIVSWDGGFPKYDIRVWDAQHSRMTKGITLYPNEIESLKKALNECDFSEYEVTLNDI